MPWGIDGMSVCPTIDSSWLLALASTYEDRRSHDGVTCWDSSPVRRTRTISCVRWSTTVVVGGPEELGT
jgi:hypothetical protein